MFCGRNFVDYDNLKISDGRLFLRFEECLCYRKTREIINGKKDKILWIDNFANLNFCYSPFLRRDVLLNEWAKILPSNDFWLPQGNGSSKKFALAKSLLCSNNTLESSPKVNWTFVGTQRTNSRELLNLCFQQVLLCSTILRSSCVNFHNY